MVRIKGSQLRDIFDHAAQMTNGVLQVSKGSRYLFEPGKGVREIWINDRILADEKLYWVASSNFVTAGGDGYSEFEHAIERVETGENIVDIVEDFLVRKKIYRPVYEDRLILK